MTDSLLAAHGARASRNVPAWHMFLVMVSAATLLPLIAVPYAQHVMPGSSAALTTIAALNFFGSNFHVAATGWFYTDREMRSHFRSRPLRFALAPVLLIVGSAAVFQFAAPSLRAYLLMAFLCWQLWHYQKQNVGLLSFIAAGTDHVSLSVWERRTLMLAAIAGILGFFSVSEFRESSLSPQLAQIHQIGALVYLFAPVSLCVAIVKNPALRTNPLRLACLVLGTAFFVPTFIFPDQLSATLGYALAHGLQYLVFMGVVSAGKGENSGISLARLLILATFGAVVLNAARDAVDLADVPYGFALYGVFLGVVMAHFVLDADIWRLREPFQRGYMRERFHFVFRR